jgi:hypothetical protein
MSEFEKELREGIVKSGVDNKLNQFIMNGQKKMEVPFNISFDYLKSLELEKNTRLMSVKIQTGHYNFRLKHKLEKELTAKLELVDNKFIVASIKDKKTDRSILNRRYSLEEYAQTTSPILNTLYQDKYLSKKTELTKDIKASIKNGAFDLSLPIEHQRFILNNLIDSTPQFAEMQERDISTSALFKKELNNLARMHTDNSLYAQQFTKQLDISQNEIDQLIENRSLKLDLNNFKKLCEKSCNENSKEIHKVSLMFKGEGTYFNTITDIKMKIGKDGQDKVIKIGHDNKQYLIGADIFESKTDTLNMFYSLSEQIEKSANDNDTIRYDLNNILNSVSGIEKNIQLSFNGIDRDLPIEKQIELGTKALDKEAVKHGLIDHKELISTDFGIDSVSDTFTTELIEKVADSHSRVISESDLADIYDNDSKLEKAVERFEELHPLPRDLKLSIIEDLRTGRLTKQSKAYEAKNGLFQDNLKVEGDFFIEYISNKDITDKQLKSVSLHDITSALSHTQEHNKNLDRLAVKHRVLSF